MGIHLTILFHSRQSDLEEAIYRFRNFFHVVSRRPSYDLFPNTFFSNIHINFGVTGVR